MNKKRFTPLLVAAFILGASPFIRANQPETIYIQSAKFTSPLLDKWITEYSKTNQSVRIKLADNQVKEEEVAIKVITSDTQEEAVKGNNQTITYIGRYAILPVTSTRNPLLTELGRKKLNNKKLKELFFEKDILADDASDPQKGFQATVYSGNSETSAANVFASHFGYKTSSLKGKKIAGDDAFLINAIQKDTTGITFNNLSYIFDIKSRQLKNNLAVIPLDLKKEQREVIEEAGIDKTLELLENESIDLIPIEKIGFAYESNDVNVRQFVRWILSEGQKYNHDYGFLKPGEKLLSDQKQQFEDQFLTSTNSK